MGDIDKLKNQRAWIAIMPIPYMEVETAWARVAAYQAPEWMSEMSSSPKWASRRYTI